MALVKIRKRFNAKRLAKINEMIPRAETAEKQDKNDDDDNNNISQASIDEQKDEPNQTSDTNQGTLILNATCAPADMRYPTDLDY